MNESDRLFFEQFLTAAAADLDGFIDHAFHQRSMLPTHVHSLQMKPLLRKNFHIEAEIQPSFHDFMARNAIAFHDVELAVFDKLWAQFALRHKIDF